MSPPWSVRVALLLSPFALCPAFPDADYYGDSAPWSVAQAASALTPVGSDRQGSPVHGPSFERRGILLYSDRARTVPAHCGRPQAAAME